MDFYKLIKELPYIQIVRALNSKIKCLEINSKDLNNNIDYIGFKLDYNPTDYHLDEKEVKVNLDIRNIHTGYIPKDTKIVYGMLYDSRGLICNDGKYYYVDDDSYIYDFCRYIKDKDVRDEYHLFDYILKFIKKYYGIIRDNNDRESMHQMICKEEGVYLEPIDIHKLSDFYKKGNAVCTEISLMAENILSVFGFNTYYVVGNMRIGEKEEYHAYNLINYIEKESKEERNAIIDFASYTDVFDVNYNKVGEKPYIVFFDEINEKFLNKLVLEKESITYEDYDFLMLDSLIEMRYERDREYYISNAIELENQFKKKIYEIKK